MKKLVILFTVVSIILISSTVFAGEKGNEIFNPSQPITNQLNINNQKIISNDSEFVDNIVKKVKIVWLLYQATEVIRKVVNWSIYGTTEAEVQEKYFEKLQSQIERYDNMYDGSSYSVISNRITHLSPYSINERNM